MPIAKPIKPLVGVANDERNDGRWSLGFATLPTQANSKSTSRFLILTRNKNDRR